MSLIRNYSSQRRVFPNPKPKTQNKTLSQTRDLRGFCFHFGFFFIWGLWTQQHHHVQQQQQVIEVAPMYREQSKRPRFYAPAYVSNAVPRQQQAQHHLHHHYHRVVQSQQKLQPTLSFKAQQSLQKFMPKDVQVAVNVAMAATAPVVAPPALRGSSRVRTVQIVKPHSTRTFKVLEQLDQAGVKTIKILGASNEQPQGRHQVVKVVTQNAHSGAESHVQTVKIYDDVQQPLRLLPQSQPQSNAYLPPARPRSRIVRQASKPLRLHPVASL